MIDLRSALGFRWDPDQRLVEAADAVHRLSGREAAILGVVVAAGGAAVSRATLAEAAGVTDERAVDFTIRRLRKKIERDPGQPRILLTVHGAGYRLGVARAAEPVAVPPVPLLSLGDCRVDLGLGLVRRGFGDEETLTTQQLAVLQAMVDAAGAPVPRRQLARRVGTTPRSIDSAVVVLRKRVEEDPSRPRHLLTVRGVGYRLVRERARTNLVDPGELRHRARERAEIDRALTEQRCVAVIGPTGVGKSHLAEHVAWGWVEALPGGAWFADCASATSAADVARAACAALRVTPRSDPVVQLVATMAEREPLLLVLDDVDLAEDVSGLVARLSRTPAKVLLTSSRRLDLPNGQVVPLDGLVPEEAAALYRRSAARAGARLPVDSADLDAFVRAVDGLPLAVVLAAHHADAVPPSAGLGGRAGLDDLAIDPSLGRHASIRTAFDRVWARCTPVERRTLRACAEFLDPFTPTAAAALGVGRELEALLARSLVAVGVDGRRSYRLLGLVRAYVLDRSAPAPELAAAHAAWFANEARRILAQWRTAADAENLPALAASAHDFERAALVADEADAADIVWLHSLWAGAGPAHADRAAALTTSAQPAIRHRAWVAVGRFRLDANDVDGVLHAADAADAADAGGAESASTWSLRGRVAMRRGESLTPLWAPVDELEQIDWLCYAALRCFTTGEGDGVALASQALRRARRRGDRRGALDAEFVLALFEPSASRAAERFARCAEACRAEEQVEAAFLWTSAAMRWIQAGQIGQATALLDRAAAVGEAVESDRIRFVVARSRLNLSLADGDPASLREEAERIRARPGGEWGGEIWFRQSLLCAAEGWELPTAPPEAGSLREMLAYVLGGPAVAEPPPSQHGTYAIWHMVRHHRSRAPLPREVAERVHRDPLLRLMRRVLR